MPEYVYALHNFVPEHEDEIAFEAGQPIEVVEKDDLYNDGWWQGRNLAGKIGLFPQSYTAPAIPPDGVFTSTPPSSSAPVTTPPDSLSPLDQEHEPTPLHDGDTESKIGIAIGEPDPADGEVMKATMTDVQKAIEQLGRSDRDGAQSFSFSSTRDGDTDRETDGTETDGEIGQGWHRSARDKLAEQARKVVEAQAAEEARDAHAYVHAPPIDVEMSDDSELEEDEAFEQHLQHMHFTRDHPHIPEEEEEEEARRHSVTADYRRKNSNETSSAILPKDDLSEEEAGERVLSPTRPSFTSSSPPPRSTRSPILNDRRSPKLRSTPTTPNAINIVAPVPIVPVGTPIIPMTTSPAPMPRATPTPSVTRDSPQATALPSPALTAPGTRQHSRHPSQQTSASSGGRASVRTSAQSAPESETQKASPSASEWSVDEVVEWLKSKGFGPDVYDKFIEQEITGDVLLELDINLLKVEIGIVAFGKRMRIANAITELRRPSSLTIGDHVPQHTLSIGRSVSQSFSHVHSPSGSTQHSLNSPQFASMGSSTLNGPPSSTLSVGGPASLIESPRTDVFMSPHITKRVSSLSSAAASMNGGSIDGHGGVATGVEKAGLMAVAGLGLEVLRETRLSTSSPGGSVMGVPEEKSDRRESGNGLMDEDKGASSEAESPPTSAKVSRLRLFGRSTSSSGSINKEKERSETPSDTKSTSPPGTVSPRFKRHESPDETSVPARQPRNKRSAEVNKGAERHSLFAGTFSTTIGRSRKPPPRVTSTLLEETSPTEKSSTLGLSRLYSRKASSTRPSTSDGSVMGSFRSGQWVTDHSAKKAGERDRARSLERAREQEKAPSKVKPKEEPESGPPRKQTATPQPGSRGPNALKPGKSIVEQIGRPDHEGWMRKKGDHYNSWKVRYFIIKGPHMYILRSNSKTETKIKGYVNIVGYKVIADENIDPGRYGFRIVHDTDKTHCFSSDEQAVVREWMKAIMKATIGRDYSKPVVSSVNIPTIPLTVAQAMNPAPRPPSPTARAAMQKALRRENPNQLSTRDARILMGLPSTDNATRDDNGQDSDRPRIDSFFNESAETGENRYGGLGGSLLLNKNIKNAPPRPSRESRRASLSGQELLDSLGTDNTLVDWANSHLPRSLQMTDPAGPLFGGLALLRLAEDMMGKSATPPIPDSAFPSVPNDDKLDGLFRLFDFLLDNDVKMGAVSINDIRQGKRDKVMQLLKALKNWEDRRKEIVKSVAQGVMSNGPLMIPSW